MSGVLERDVRNQRWNEEQSEIENQRWQEELDRELEEMRRADEIESHVERIVRPRFVEWERDQEDIEDDIEPTNIPIPGSGGQGCKVKMNLNIAAKVQLMQAVQIGPAFANDLITARPFGSWDEVAKLSGIGKVRLSNLQSLFFLSAGVHKPFVSDLEDELEFEVIDDDDEEFGTIDDDDEKFELTVPSYLYGETTRSIKRTCPKVKTAIMIEAYDSEQVVQKVRRGFVVVVVVVVVVVDMFISYCVSLDFGEAAI